MLIATSYEQELVDRMVEGDNDALGQVLQYLSKIVYRFFYYKASDLSPDDLTQEFVLRMLDIHARRGYPLTSRSFRSYCKYAYAVARTVLRDAASRSRNNNFESLSESVMVPDSFTSVENSEFVRSVFEYWRANFSETDVYIVGLRLFASLPFEQIAESIGPGWTSEAVRQRYQRLLKRTRYDWLAKPIASKLVQVDS